MFCSSTGWDSKGRFSGILVVFIAFLVYANSVGNGHVWDDEKIVVNNLALRSSPLALFSNIDTASEVDPTPYYRPLTHLSFLIEERLHGLDPAWMHLLNVLLHSANALLVYFLARAIIDNSGAALLAGLLFAVHPLNSESVNFISGGRNTMLASFFVLAAYLLHRKGTAEGRRSFASAGALCFLAGLFSKETAVVALPFVASLEIGSFRTPVLGGRLQAAGRLLPYAAGFALYITLRGMAISGAGVQLDVFPGLGARLMDNLYIIPHYLMTVVWPLSLGPQYYVPDDLHLFALPLATAWLSILGCLGWLLSRGRNSATVFGLAWLAGFWLPASGIIPIPSAQLADRYLYLPAIGIWLIIADQSVRMLHSKMTTRRYTYTIVIGVPVLLGLAVLTILQNRDWKSDVDLFSRYVERNPDHAFGHHNLGCAYLDKVGDLDSAERSFEKALSLDPNFPRLRTQMGYVRLLRGDLTGALIHYEESISQNPFDAEARLNRGIIFERLGRFNEAAVEYRWFLATPGSEFPQARTQAEERMREITQILDSASVGPEEGR